MKPTVIYHSADYDGIFCREIARKFLTDAELIGWNFGDPPILMPDQGTVYVLDLSPDCLVLTDEQQNQIVWIDHHKTSIEKWPSSIPGYRIDGVAACRLAWQWFNGTAGVVPNLIPKYSYIDRVAVEPLAVRLAGEYDIWDKRDPRAETFQYALRCIDNIPWGDLLSRVEEDTVVDMLKDGFAAQRYAQKTDDNLVRHKSYRLKWESLNFLVLNTGRFNSLTFAALDVPETGHDALMGYMFNGKCWTVSLYHAKHRTDIDLSEIAKKYGGGGHRGACGFTCDKLPF